MMRKAPFIGVIAVAVVVLALAACTQATPTPTPTPSPPRLDLGDGVVVAFAQGSSEELHGKVAYITHVPSGSQVVLDRQGQVIKEHDGRDEGSAHLQEVLTDEAAMERIMVSLQSDSDTGPWPSTVDFVPFVKFDGIMYQQNRLAGTAEEGHPLTEDHLGPELYRVAFKLEGYAGADYRSQDGDAAWLDPGTPIYAVKGYAPEFRLAAVSNGQVVLFEAATNPAAKVGADLLDIGGKVISIGINSPLDGRTELASIGDPGMVEGLVEMVLMAPVDQSCRSSDGERYFISFHLEDGTAATRAFWLESGELSRGIMTPAFFQAAILRSLADAGARFSKDGLQISEELAVKLAMESFGRPAPGIVPVEDAHDPVARLMRLSEYEALRGGSIPESADPPVWVVEAEGAWSDAGIVPPELRRTYRYASAAIDAQTGEYRAGGRSNEPVLGPEGRAPLVAPTPTLTPTPSPILTATPTPARDTSNPNSILEYRIAFQSDRPKGGGNTRIYAMDVTGLHVTNLSGDGGFWYDEMPTWSPDGSHIAFWSSREGKPEDGWIVGSDIFAANADGSNVVNLTRSSSTETNPAWSPDGSQIAFKSDRDGNGEIYVMDADGSNQRNLTNHPGEDRLGAWSPDGSQIAFIRIDDGGGLFVMDADGANVERLNDIGGMDIAWSPDGSRIAFVNIVDEPEGLPGVWVNKEIFVIDTDGSNLMRLTNDPAWDDHPVWSPDGSRIAFETRRDELPNDNNSEINVMDADGANVTRLTDHPAPDGSPAWSPDGSHIAFMSFRDRNWEIYVMDTDGANVTNLTNDPSSDMYPVWSPESGRRGLSARATPTPTPTPTAYPPSAGIHTPDDLRRFLDSWPSDLKLVVNDDVVVKFCTSDCPGFIIFPAVVHHVPSMSQVFLGLDAEVAIDPGGNEMKSYESEEGGQALENVLADEALMSRIRARIHEIFGTPTPGVVSTEPPHLLQAMGKLPCQYEDDAVWFVDLGRAWDLAGMTRLDSAVQFLALDELERQVYLKVLDGLHMSGHLSLMMQDRFEQMDAAFGFSMFQEEWSISAEGTSSGPVPPEYVKGDFDAGTIRQRLVDLGYEERQAAGLTYYAIRGDYEFNLQGPVGWTQHIMNRVYVDEGRTVSAPATEPFEAMLETIQGNTPSVAESPAYSVIARSLGDPLAAVIMPRALAFDETSLWTFHTPVRGLPKYTRQETWNTLHEWRAMGIGYSRDAEGRQWLTVSLFYFEAGAAEADAAELVERMTTYQSLVWPEDRELMGYSERPFQECAALSSSARGDQLSSVLTVECAFGVEESLKNWWMMVQHRDLGFLVP